MSEPADRDHQLFRSHFLSPEQLADRGAQAHQAQAPDDPPLVEPIEKEVDNGWLNVRVGDSEWAAVHELSRVTTDRTQQGRIPDAPPPNEFSERPSYADPVAGGMDPTAPDSPESRF
jgi:hypothetical protein